MPPPPLRLARDARHGFALAPGGGDPGGGLPAARSRWMPALVSEADVGARDEQAGVVGECAEIFVLDQVYLGIEIKPRRDTVVGGQRDRCESRIAGRADVRDGLFAGEITGR